MFRSAFQDKTVLLTGHTGFKGSWLSLWLNRLGANVVGYAHEPPTKPSLFTATGLHDLVEDLRGDVRDAEALVRVIERHRPDFVFHLAAQALVRESYANPRETFDVNVMGTLALLDAIRTVGLRAVLVAVTTDKCYENKEWVYGYREDDSLGGHDPYSASKGAMEIAVASYRRSFFPTDQVNRHGLKIATARAGNVIGGGDWSTDRILPDAIRALSRGCTLEVRSPGSVRPWQHVLEPLAGYLWLAARLAEVRGEQLAGGWNFGPLTTDAFTVAELADAVVRSWGSGRWIAVSQSNAPHEARQLRLCIDKAQAELGWFPVWDFTTTIERTVGWYRRVLESGEALIARSACLDDIRSYETAALQKKPAWIS